MAQFLLQHTHEAAECDASFAAWQGFDSPLRHEQTISTCLAGDHRLWWCVEAPNEAAALSMLPVYVAERTEPVRVRAVAIP